jgi:hypothetical protein
MLSNDAEESSLVFGIRIKKKKWQWGKHQINIQKLF